MDNLERAIRAALVDGKLPCARAFAVAAGQRVEPIQVGQEASRLGIRISRCQLGLFGYDEQGKKSIVQPAASVDGELEEVVRTQLIDDRLPCAKAWEIAKEHDLPKLEVASAVEGLKLRLSACQLGCFT